MEREPWRCAYGVVNSTMETHIAPSSAFSAPSFSHMSALHIACFRGNAQIYSGATEHVASAALHKSAIRGIQELRKVSRITERIHANRPWPFGLHDVPESPQNNQQFGLKRTHGLFERFKLSSKNSRISSITGRISMISRNLICVEWELMTKFHPSYNLEEHSAKYNFEYRWIW